MKLIVGALAVALLAGCSSVSSLEGGEPELAASTTKAPAKYAKCLMPKWQEINAATTSTETETGYRLLLSVDFVGAAALANIDKAGTGSQVQIYKSSGIVGSGKWAEAARSCL
ncbi:hypothetical protein [Pseudomonas sp. PDM31]|uniref:hypothetical protein n=1 Tax=Pseudomonas sp. PDM31 TaxID=2854778 RepID=UPI001C44F36E|nr:hypothetical protein [Pseudomonas sp. PDM31]MBV7478192.1 hypothetical protein [Pseudomonas sp. PDM31]